MSKDEQVDRILWRSLGPAGPGAASASCLSPETLAAWSEGALLPHEREAAEAHAAGCDRCLATIAALARTEPRPAQVRQWHSFLTVRWLVPATAGLAAVALWVAVDTRDDARVVDELAQRARESAPLSTPEPQQQPPPSAPGPEQQERKAERDVPAPPVAERQDVPKRQPAVKESADAVGERRRDTAADAAPPAEAKKPEAPPAAQPAAQPAPASPSTSPFAAARVEEGVGRRMNAMSGPAFVITSPDPAIRWRVAATTVEHSRDEGRTWEAQETGARVPLLAGAAPTPTVCWLVGRAGSVFVTVDGRTWRQTVPPAGSDLVGVSADGPLIAAVKTTDGVTYRTSDGGITWVLQETAAASF
jgi:hypothetical protein